MGHFTIGDAVAVHPVSEVIGVDVQAIVEARVSGPAADRKFGLIKNKINGTANVGCRNSSVG